MAVVWKGQPTGLFTRALGRRMTCDRASQRHRVRWRTARTPDQHLASACGPFVAWEAGGAKVGLLLSERGTAVAQPQRQAA